MKHGYQVIVGNIGTVYSGGNKFQAITKYNTYVGQSKRGYGRAADESVTLMADGEPIREHFGKMSEYENPSPASLLPASWKTAMVRRLPNGQVQVKVNPARRYPTSKKPGDPTYSAQWSGVTGAPKCGKGGCPDCGGRLHHEGGSHYCPYCDDFKRRPAGCKYD
jgi:hypothetical protein